MMGWDMGPALWDGTRFSWDGTGWDGIWDQPSWDGIKTLWDGSSHPGPTVSLFKFFLSRSFKHLGPLNLQLSSNTVDKFYTVFVRKILTNCPHIQLTLNVS